MRRILVCGGAGFIGSNFIHHLLETHSDYEVINYDKLTYAGNLENLTGIADHPRYTFVQGDIADEQKVFETVESFKIDSVINFAAETHVTKSILAGSRDFVLTNVLGVQTLLDVVRKYQLEKFLNVSTDEVFGTLDLDEEKSWNEDSPLEPNVPYAAAKAGGDLLCRSYFKTYNLPVVVTRCANNYGPYQYPEKLIPFTLFRLMNNEEAIIHGDGLHVRDWIYVRDHCEALDLLLHRGRAGEIYNICADNERHTIDVAKMILDYLGRPHSMLMFVPDRLGNDRRYSLDGSKLKKEFGWRPRHKFAEALPMTVRWYLDNYAWVKNAVSRNEAFNLHVNYEAVKTAKRELVGLEKEGAMAI